MKNKRKGLKQSQQRLLMGEVVLVEVEYIRIREPIGTNGKQKREWVLKRRETPRAGWVTGFRRLQSGIYTPGRDFEDYVPEFKATDFVEAAMVVYWPTMNPVFVPMAGFKLYQIRVPEPPKYKWTENDKEKLRSDMREYPRDEKGRWRS